MADIQYYVEYITKKHEALAKIPPVHVYINRINNRLLFRKIDRNKLEFETLKLRNLLGSTKKVIDETKNGENTPSVEVVEVGSVQCNLVDSQYQQMSKIFYTFKPNKFCVDLLKVEESNLVFLKHITQSLIKLLDNLLMKIVQHY